jgi:hypothetical protein
MGGGSTSGIFGVGGSFIGGSWGIQSGFSGFRFSGGASGREGSLGSFLGARFGSLLGLFVPFIEFIFAVSV